MGYESSLVRRWTRRDHLTIAVIAVTVAFFTGTTVVVAAAAEQTTQIAAEYGAVGYVYSGSGPTTLSVASLTDGGTYVGLPVPPVTLPGGEAVWPASNTVSREGLQAVQQTTLSGIEGQTTVAVHPRRPLQTVFPGDWYVGPSRVVETLGQTSSIAVESAASQPSSSGSPLRGALVFFVQGTNSLLALLRVLTVGAAVLVAVTVYAVVRTTVRDKRKTIAVLRATGARPRDILLPFSIRAGLLTLVGVFLGYAIGVILPNAAINIAVFAGVPVSLAARVTIPTLATLLPGYVAVVGAGVGAGVFAAWPATRDSPLDNLSERPVQSFVPSVLRPRLLKWRAFVPTVSALTVFIVVTVLLASLAGALAPMFAPTNATITEPGAVHPVASTIPSSQATAFEALGVTASPEILLFSVVRGQPFLSRGAHFPAFTNVTDAHLVSGREPRRRHEAVIGADLAETLDVAVGDRLILGGSTTAALTRVKIVGRFSGSGITDDQLVVSLPTARHLSNVPPGKIQFVRISETVDVESGNQGLHVLGVSVSDTAVVGNRVPVTARVINLADTERTETIEFSVGNQTKTRRLTLPPSRSVSVTLPVRFTESGRHRIQVRNTSAAVRVQPQSALRVTALPTAAPPNSTLVFRVLTARGGPASNATASFGRYRATATNQGIIEIPVPQANESTLRISTANASFARKISVARTHTRSLLTTVSVTPRSPSLLTQPTLSVTATNPWSRTIERTLSIRGPQTQTSWTVSVPPGESRTTTQRLPRQPPGTYTATVRTAGQRLSKVSFRVTGDDRLATALATRITTKRGSTLGQAIQTVFGNIQVLIGTFVALGALVTIGSVTAGFTYAVRARRRTIGIRRAVGTPPVKILKRILADAVRVGATALVVALIVGYVIAFALAQSGYTTVYGVRILPRNDSVTIITLLVGGLTVILTGAIVAAIPVIRAEPHELLDGETE